MTNSTRLANLELPKAPTGIIGLDDITNGGLPRGRPTLVCGSVGCGKTLFGMEFLVHGITQYDEPGVFVAFEETSGELTQNASSLGFALADLIDQNKLAIDHISIDRTDFEQTGDYDLDGLFIRLEYAIQKVNAKRIVLDTIEVLFSALDNTDILRAELRRLFRWLKDKGVTAVITAERGDGMLTRQGIEEYVSDCVILLENRVENRLSTRLLRIVKYRGTAHGTDEYPFLIDDSGFSVLPITSVNLDYKISDERISSGIPRLDTMLGDRGFFRGSTILVSGPTGTGKTTIASHFLDAACQRGERCLYFSFEEPAAQIIRNMSSVGLDLQAWVEANLLRFETVRPTGYSLEMHLAILHKHIQAFDPQIVVIDPVTSFEAIGSKADSRTLLTRLIDFLKERGTTGFLTSLTTAGETSEQTEVDISSLIDTWLLVRTVESSGERNRLMYVLKSRGMSHSNQISEYEITEEGINLIDAYLGKSGVLTGSARLAQAASEQEEERERKQTIELKQLQLERKRAAIQAQIAALQAELDVESAETQLRLDQEARRTVASQNYTASMARKRKVTDSANQLHTNRSEEHDNG
ncbi:MAG: circadian clock protein KaiC [Aggregatilineales bacterium]